MTSKKSFFEQLGCEVREREPMARHTTFKIGGPADLFVIAADTTQVREIITRFGDGSVPLLKIGNGSNLLVSDHGCRGIVMMLGGRDIDPIVQDSLVICPAGVSLQRLCRFAQKNGLSGLEFAYGIPGAVGGGVYMNAGAYGGQISDVIEWAEAVAPDGSVIHVSADDMKMAYRHSVFMERDMTITSAAFRLVPGDMPRITAAMDDVMSRRREKQPLEFPSAGSFFKRPPDNFAGALIENSGLKGYSVGGAQVSEKHAGFIINYNGATCDDVRRLADKVTETVLKNYSIMLESEVKYIG